jgi:ribonuclease E
MTFYEAALRILESEGRPLHFLEITEKSIAQNLLSHVGKTPELTMLSRLAAMARRTRDRKVVVTAKDTFALADWALPEDPEALAQTGLMEAHPEESLPPLRPVERHPEPRTENVRAAGRGTERKGRRREEEEEGGRRRRRFPPMPEVVFEILSEADESLRPEQLLERARSKELAAEDATVEAMLTALLEDNQRRIDAGRRPQFSLSKETGAVSLERAGAPSEAPPLELQAAFAAALGIPLEGGRPVLARAGVAATPEAQADAALLTAARTAVKDSRKAAARSVRKRLGELDVGTFEKSVVKMMHALGFRELKVAKRSKEGPLLTARKREGSVELRYAIRMLKGAPAIDRKAVQELRKDLGHYSAQVGLLACAGDVRGDARTEAQATGSLVMLWCGDALGEKFLEAKAAVTVTTVELYDLDERFFEVAKLEAEEAQKRREERQREKQARTDEGEEPGEETGPREPREAAEEGAPSSREQRREQRREERRRERDERRRERQASAEQQGTEAAAPVPAEAVAPVAPPAMLEEEQGEEGEDEGEDEDLEAASAFVAGVQPEGATPGEGGAAGERKRRRRRRRGRRGRGGRGPEGAPGTPGEAAVAAEGAAATAGVTSAEGALIAGAVAEASPAAAATAAGAVPTEGEGLAPPGEGMRTASEWQSPFPSVESAAPAEAQRTAAEEHARVAAEKAESVAEGARAPTEPETPPEPKASPEPPPSGSGSPEGGTA